MVKNRLILQTKVDIESILRKGLSSGVFSGDNFFSKKIEFENRKITIFIAEEYYYRINSNLTLTAIAEETADKTTVEIISSGGKGGLWGLSYGAEKSAAKRIVQLLKENGFKEQ